MPIRANIRHFKKHISNGSTPHGTEIPADHVIREREEIVFSVKDSFMSIRIFLYISCLVRRYHILFIVMIDVSIIAVSFYESIMIFAVSLKYHEISTPTT